ncbi:MAG: extracellular solute-binding protein, partial [bacterium]
MVTLNMWIWGAGEACEQLFKREIRAFNIKSPDVVIRPTLIPWRDAWDNIIKVAHAEEGPDVLQIGSTWNGTLAALGVLKNITREVKEADITKDMFASAAWTSCCFPGTEEISSLPWFIDLRAIYYRIDIFRELNILPEELDTWTSFERACGKINGFKKGAKEVGVLGVSGQTDALLLHNIAPWIWGAGGDFLSLDGKRAVFNSRKVIEALEFYTSLVAKGYIPLSALRLSTEDVGRIFFDKGGYVMSIPGPLGASTALDPTNPGYRADIAGMCLPALFPSGEAGKFIFFGGSNLAITSFSRHPQEAWEFIKFLVSYESQASYPLLLNMFPGLMEAFNAVFIQDAPELRGLKSAWKYGRSFPNVASWGSIESLLIQCFGKIF